MQTMLYARVSTDKQTTDNQALSLTNQWPEGTLLFEVESGMKRRPVLDTICANLRPGDTLGVAAIDRLGRSSIDVLGRIQTLLDRGVVVHSIREGRLDSSPSGRFLIAVLAAAAELERNLISERTKVGLARVRQAGGKLGAPRLGREAEVKALQLLGLSQRQIANRLAVSLGYVNGVLSA